MKPDEKKTEAPVAEAPKPEEALPEGALEGVSGGVPIGAGTAIYE